MTMPIENNAHEGFLLFSHPVDRKENLFIQPAFDVFPINESRTIWVKQIMNIILLSSLMV